MNRYDKIRYRRLLVVLEVLSNSAGEVLRVGDVVAVSTVLPHDSVHSFRSERFVIAAERDLRACGTIRCYQILYILNVRFGVGDRFA